jgi:hypothetical protein
MATFMMKQAHFRIMKHGNIIHTHEALSFGSKSTRWKIIQSSHCFSFFSQWCSTHTAHMKLMSHHSSFSLFSDIKELLQCFAEKSSFLLLIFVYVAHIFVIRQQEQFYYARRILYV